MYRGFTTEGPGERVEPRRLWEPGPKAVAMRVAAVTDRRPPHHPRYASAFSLNHYVMIT
jgi:hypothetical protein